MNKITDTSQIIHINKKQYLDFKYSLYSQPYIYRLKISNEPMIFRNIKMIDDEDNNITNKMLKYAGPNYDFHSMIYTPNDFGYKSITVYEDDTKIKTFFDKDEIVL